MSSAEEPTVDRKAPPNTMFDWLPSARWVMRAFLASQVLLAAAVIVEHGWSLERLGGKTPIETVPVAPIAPGDQRRPFKPATVPARLDLPKSADGPIRLPASLPRRLEFSMHETEAFGKVLLVFGQIDDGAAARFNGFIESLDQAPTVIALHSPGGSVADAHRIGRTIRRLQHNTLILPNAACLSACPYILAGGVERTVSPHGWVGVHQHSYSSSTVLPAFLAVEGIQNGHGKTLEYLNEMGIDPLVMIHALKTPPDDIYLLVPKELQEYRLATRILE